MVRLACIASETDSASGFLNGNIIPEKSIQIYLSRQQVVAVSIGGIATMIQR